MRRYFITAFCSGAAVMVAEIAAARAIAPHFGTSIVVWTNVIGIILVALAIGYWIGGRLAERRPDPSVLGAIILLAGALLIIPAFATPFIAGSLMLELLRQGSGFLVLLLGSFLSVVVLFALPIMLLGMVSPFLVELACRDAIRTESEISPPKVDAPRAQNLKSSEHSERGVGAVAGRLYAISTIGSLVGTFLPTLVLLPTIGTRRTILSAAAVLVLLGALLMRRRVAVIAAVVPIALLVMQEQPPLWFLGGRVVAAAESSYQYLRIIDSGDTRLLAFNEGFGVQSVAVRPEQIPDGYFAAIAALPALFDRDPLRVLILGNAGGTIGNIMQRRFPDRALEIIGVEIDPAVTALTTAHFPPPPQPYPIVHADSRVFARGTSERYDIIVVDAYTNQLTIPPHLASVEFFRLLRQRLAPGGFVVANVNGPRRDSRLLRTFERTIAATFPSVMVGSSGAWNFLILASERAGLPIDRVASEVVFASVPTGAGARESAIFTDDWAPIEMLTDLAVFNAIREYARSPDGI